MSSITKNISELIASLGGLHDATLLNLRWHPGENRLEVEIDDLYANFDGRPEYQGPAKGTFVFSEVVRFDVEVNLTQSGLMLYDWKFGKSGVANYACDISFSPGGKMSIECGHIECVKN
jgi:hypothetical protein